MIDVLNTYTAPVHMNIHASLHTNSLNDCFIFQLSQNQVTQHENLTTEVTNVTNCMFNTNWVFNF